MEYLLLSSVNSFDPEEISNHSFKFKINVFLTSTRLAYCLPRKNR